MVRGAVCKYTLVQLFEQEESDVGNNAVCSVQCAPITQRRLVLKTGTPFFARNRSRSCQLTLLSQDTTVTRDQSYGLGVVAGSKLLKRQNVECHWR